MKAIKYIIEQIIVATIIITGGTTILYTIETWYMPLIIVCYGVLVISVYILYCNARKRLESELELAQENEQGYINKINGHILRYEELEFDFAKQVKATDEAERERDNKMKVIKSITEKYDRLVEFRNSAKSTMDSLVNKEIVVKKTFPFATDNDKTEEIYICPQCGSEMPRFTNKIAFCDNIECSRKQWHISKLKGGE